MMDLFMGETNTISVDLPYDAMIHEQRTPDTLNGHHTGFYPGGQYTYMKNIFAPKEWSGKTIQIEFEGIAGLSRVYVNGDFAGANYNSYNSFYADISKYININSTNEIRVEVNCLEQASRWYSGAGIYRNVNLLIGNEIHIPDNGIRITTIEAADELATIMIEAELANTTHFARKIHLSIDVVNSDGISVTTCLLPVTISANDKVKIHQRLSVSCPLLWDDESPSLYSCNIKIVDGEAILDEEKISFGIRELRLNSLQGFCVNGRSVKLRGACIHHDNGLIGAATYESAERRRCEKLKEAGFNCLRSSHHPMSKTMLKICDELGIYVIDELTDMWTRTKNPNDYANYFSQFWENDLKSMIQKDYNHPCVIMYSFGNEIQEAGTAQGADLCRKMNAWSKELDSTRYTVNGINGLIAGNSRMGEIMQQITGMTMEQMASAQEQLSDDGNDNSSGADQANGMMKMMVGPIADGFATSSILYEMIDEYASSTDIAGYNYLTALHVEEKLRRPERVVLGTETFPADIASLWQIVEENPHVIGDMTWAGYDYIGEAGCGIFKYDGTQNFSAHWPDRLAGIGDIDILGNRKPISYFREIVFGLRKAPYIAIMRMNRNGQKSSQTPWMWKDNIASWTWPGYEGQMATVDVYSNSEEVELFIDGDSLGKKTISKFMASFSVPYTPGRITAVSYSAGRETGRQTLKSANNTILLDVSADKSELNADGMDLAFVTIRLVDQNGNTNMFAKKKISISIEGAANLQGFGSANPTCEGSYQDTQWETYDGKVMAVVRSATKSGEVLLTFEAEGCDKKTLLIVVG
jgi:hypothetical protein